MHILLTDVLACPRCGPDFGLVLLADRLDARRVVEGSLGCANCRERYLIRGGTADLRPRVDAAAGSGPVAPGSGEAAPVPAEPGLEPVGHTGGMARGSNGGGDEDDDALRLAALLGVTEGPAILLLSGATAALARPIADRLENVEVVAAGQAGAGAPEPGISRVVLGGRLPFASRSLRGVALDGREADAPLEEGARVLAPMHRLVLAWAGEGARVRARAAGLEVLAEEGGTLVALKREAPDPPKLHQLT